MKRATMDDVDRLFLEHDDKGLTTSEIISALQAAGFDADSEWFFQEIAPRLMGEATEYLGDKATGTIQ